MFWKKREPRFIEVELVSEVYKLVLLDGTEIEYATRFYDVNHPFILDEQKRDNYYINKTVYPRTAVLSITEMVDKHIKIKVEASETLMKIDLVGELYLFEKLTAQEILELDQKGLIRKTKAE